MKVIREPILRIAKREQMTGERMLLIRALAAVSALLTGGLLLLMLGHNPVRVYADMIAGSLSGATALRETVRLAVPLLIAALSISFAFAMRFWNIGAEGQILFGAIFASYFGLFQADALPCPLLLLVMALAGMAGGALAGFFPALCKAKWNTNETLFTLMLNYIALCLLKYLQNGPWKDPMMRGFPKIAMFAQSARLPQLFGVHIGWVIALLLVAAAYVYSRHTKHGYEISVVGESPRTAAYAGMNVRFITVRTMLLSGALCGLAGYLQVAGADYTLTEATAGGVGFTAITVAWLSRLNPIAMVFVSLAIAVLKKGANKIQTTFKIPASAADVLTGVLLFFMLGCEFFIQYRLIARVGRRGRNGRDH